MPKRSRYSQGVKNTSNTYQKSRGFTVVEDPSDPYGYRLVQTPGDYYGPAYAPQQALGLLGEGNIYGGLPYDYKTSEQKAGLTAEQYRPGAGFGAQQISQPTPTPAPVKEDVGYKPQLAEYEKIRKVAAETGDPEAIKQAEELGMAIFNAKYSEENPALIAGDRGVSYAGRLETNPLMEAATAADTAAQSFEQNYRKSLTDAAKEEGALLPTVNYQNFNTEVPDLFPKLPDGTSSIDPRFSQLNYTENLGYSPEELINLNYSMGAGQSTGTLPAQTSPEAYMDALDDAVLRSQDFMKQFAANRLGTSMGGE